MRRARLRHVSQWMILFFVFLPPLFAQPRTFPNTKDGIFVFYDQLPDWLSSAQWQFAATHYVGCQKVIQSNVRTLRGYNPGFIVLHYQLGLGQGHWAFIDGEDWVQDWNDALPDFRSYAGAGPVSKHDEWFVTWEGARVHQTAWDWYVMDITFNGPIPTSGYPDYWLASCKAKMRNTECDGVFADSLTVDGYFGQVQSSHPWFSDISSCLANWVPALESYAAYIRSDFAAQPEKFYFLPNLGALVTGWDSTDYSALGDGGMNEGFGEWAALSPYDLADWQLQMNRLLSLARADKILLLECDPDVDNLSERAFLIGCYLLIKGEKTYVTLSGADVDCEWFPEYEIDLGAYTGAIPVAVDSLYIQAWGVYRRDYEKGFVLVNPSASNRTIPSLGGTFRLITASGGGEVPPNGIPSGSLGYQNVSGLALAPYSAAVLLHRALAADLNSDGAVDSLDLGILMSGWNTGDSAADINGDGRVDGDDLVLMLEQWSR